VNIEDENLFDKIQELKRGPTVKDGESFDIKYQGMVIPIKNEKLKFNLNRINEVTEKIEAESDLSKKINAFTDIFNILDEVVKVIKKEKSEETQQTESKILIN
jgi:hypothetical protein